MSDGDHVIRDQFFIFFFFFFLLIIQTNLKTVRLHIVKA